MLYNDLRPQTFEELVGLEHVVITLKNSWQRGNPFRILIFEGQHGTGKTTTARVYCNWLGINYRDIWEIDAAVNSGVANVREIVDNANNLPIYSEKYRAIILDEAHNLSRSAFDALLKLLEEPPEHLIFIMCTTNLGIFPSTVRSRCITFPFRAISQDAMINYTNTVAKDILGLNPEEGIIERIVTTSKGSLRDVLTLLDKFDPDYMPLTHKTFNAIHGEADMIDIANIAQLLIAGQGIDTLNYLLELQYTTSPKAVNQQLLMCLRDIMLKTVDNEYVGLYPVEPTVDIDKVIMLLKELSPLYKGRNTLTDWLPIEMVIMKQFTQSQTDVGDGYF